MSARSILMGMVFVALWSSAFATARVIVAHAPPLSSLAIRFAISGLLAVLLARALGQSFRLTRQQGLSVVVFGLCQNTLYLGLNFIALQWIEASLAVIIAASMPLLVAALGWAFGGQKITFQTALGLTAGFLGVALIMGSRVTEGADPIGILLCVIAAVALAVATLTMGSASSGGNLLMIVGLQMLAGSAALAVVAAAIEPWHFDPNPAFFAAFLWQVLAPGLAATLLWFKLVSDIGTVRAAAFHFLNPAFGVLVAIVLLGESVHWTDLIGIAITMVGILLVQRARIAASR
ncbi:DMT family transporter [Xinfangfangia sp. CPCC 101601]|uniref:DMT family transporter n=1 Tax=Pseudogemmobacter lacusdianii TaxID=3069608 RepID=A0ABU0VUA9_9RHOB|nr:DMT family transporter [Xinfangfangia sp. CPCC 101601]MDQ2065243.1 DMT family transporter [Xinfangfangia sp. CPCC 101601]